MMYVKSVLAGIAALLVALVLYVYVYAFLSYQDYRKHLPV
jgi:hypothetical protein